MEKIAIEFDFDHAVVSKSVKWEGDGLRYNTAIYSRYPLKEVHDFYPQLSLAGLCIAIDSKEFGILLKNLSAHLKAAGIVHSKAAEASSDHYPVWAILE